MTDSDIRSLLAGGSFPKDTGRPELLETHISWVLIGAKQVYKIKKPVRYSFLDFSTLEKRKYYCEREIILNRRLTQNIYQCVVPITVDNGRWILDGKSGIVADYAVRMRRMDPDRRMDLLLANGGVTIPDILQLADRIALFHERAEVIREPHGPGMAELFNDLGRQAAFLDRFARGAAESIHQAISISNVILGRNAERMDIRRARGCYRDGHGDLHLRNIFLLEQPQVFDCIEFNDDYRRIDVLNDIAFLCMDLDSLGQAGMAEMFYDRWTARTRRQFGEADRQHFEADRQIFEYYKAYRANIRAKVNSLRAASADTERERSAAIAASLGYLRLLENYCRHLALGK